jgi:hypothetical protein
MDIALSVLFTASFGHCIVCSIYRFFWTLYCLVIFTTQKKGEIEQDNTNSNKSGKKNKKTQCPKEAVKRTRQYNVQKKW